MVESTALEMRRTCKRTVGSNPTLSARLSKRSARLSTRNLPDWPFKAADQD